jgi:hypothetical protein
MCDAQAVPAEEAYDSAMRASNRPCRLEVDACAERFDSRRRCIRHIPGKTDRETVVLARCRNAYGERAMRSDRVCAQNSEHKKD